MIANEDGPVRQDCGRPERSGKPARTSELPAESSRPQVEIVLEGWGLEAVRPPAADYLIQLHEAWVANVPFENVTKLMRASGSSGKSLRRSPREFWSDHLKWGSGGTCFDVTVAFRALLRKTGFDPRIIFCRVPEGRRGAHVALLVQAGKESFLVDAGYALPIPVRLPARGAARQRTPFYDVEVRHGVGKEFLVFTEDDRGTRFRYSFKDEPVTIRELTTAWDATFEPGAPFMERLALGKLRDGARYIYKGPSSLFILSRREQNLVNVPASHTDRLSSLFGISESLLKRGMTLL